MSDEQKPGDPADRAADGAFGGVQSHRAGYGDDKLQRLTEWLRAHPTATLASGEGALLLAEIDRLQDELHTQDGWVQWANAEMNALRRANKDSMDHYADARAEIDRLRGDLQKQADWADWAKGEIDRLRDQLHLADQSARSSSAEAARLGRILAALREPSEAVVKAVKDAIYEELGIDYWDGKTRRILYYAVAAAEQEVGGE